MEHTTQARFRLQNQAASSRGERWWFAFLFVLAAAVSDGGSCF